MCFPDSTHSGVLSVGATWGLIFPKALGGGGKGRDELGSIKMNR